MSSIFKSNRFKPNAVVRDLEWQEGAGPRVHIEDDNPERYRNVANALRGAGFQIGPFCGGPHYNDTAQGDFRCPFVESGECNAVEEADVILFRYSLEGPKNAALLESLVAADHSHRVVVEVREESAATHTELLAHCRVLAAPATVDDIVAAVRAEVGV
jgi:hypothetical protein